MDKCFDFSKKWGLNGKFVLSMMMSTLAIVLFAVAPSRHRLFCMIAMLLSSVGDILLMDFRHWFSRLHMPYFVVGACAFMSAHIFYILAYGTMLKENQFSLISAGFYVGLILPGCGLIAITVMALKLRKVKPAMFFFFILYLVFISCNCATITSLAVSMGNWRLIAAGGAASFFLSDTCIGVNKLLGNEKRPEILSELIWILYPIGQILLIIAG